MTKIAFLTLGCKLNYAETSTYERGFMGAGLEKVAANSSDADVYLINTCSVTATSDSKSRNLVRKVHRQNPDALVIVTGCSAELRRQEIEQIEGVSRVFGATEKSKVVPETLALLGFPAKFIDDSNIFAAFSTGERTRSFLKVQDGCNNYCNYCTVPYARGESRNLSICECVKGAQAIAAQGVKEIVLTGVNTGDFGRTTGESFLDLLKALDAVEGIERYRISSIEPNLITEEIIDWIASGTKFLPHFHIPLQTGSDILLEKMGRHYDTAFFKNRIDYIRGAMEGPGKPDVFFGIDLMVGLPGETDALFQDSYNFIKELEPAFVHVFPYSRRPGTPAADYPDQVSEAKKKERVGLIEELNIQLQSSFTARQKGKTLKVLFESKEKDGTMSGYSENYVKVTVPYDSALVGKVTEVKL